MRKEVLAEGVELYLGDCREVLLGLGPEDITTSDAIITDPPYGISLQTKNAGRDQRPYQKHGDIVRAAKTKKHDFEAIIGDDRPFDPSDLLLFPNLVIWGANNFADRLPASHCWFSWDKKCGKAADSDIGDCELAWTRGIRFKTVRAFRHMWAGFQRDSEVGGVRFHPTQKPVELLKWCIEFFPSAQVILDPYMGSGTTGIAAVNLGRKFIGVEIELKYFDVACKRISAATKQTDMFIEKPAPAKQEAFEL